MAGDPPSAKERHTDYKSIELPADQATYGESCVLCLLRSLHWLLMVEGMVAVGFGVYLYSVSNLCGVVFTTLVAAGTFHILFSLAVNRCLYDRATCLQCYVYIAFPVLAWEVFVGILCLWLGLSYTDSWTTSPPGWAETLFQVSQHPELLNSFNPRIGGLLLCTAAATQLLGCILANNWSVMLRSKAHELRIPVINSISPAYDQHMPQSGRRMESRLSDDRSPERAYLKQSMHMPRGREGGYMQRFHNKYYDGPKARDPSK